MLFAKEHRTKILAEHENQLSNQEVSICLFFLEKNKAFSDLHFLPHQVSKILGVRWKGMSLEEKKPFIGKAARIRKEFKKKYPDFSWHKEKGKKRNCDSQKHKHHKKSKKKSKTHKIKRHPEPRRVEGISEAFLDFEDKWQKARESELIMTQIMEGKAKVWTEVDKEPPEDKTVIYLPVLVDRGLYVKEFFNSLKNMGNIYVTLSVANNNNDKGINLMDHCNKEASLPEYRELLVENDMSVQYIMSNAFLISDSVVLRDSLDSEDTEECVGVALFSPATDGTGGSYDNSVSYRNIDTLRPSERKESTNFGNVEGRRKDNASGENQQQERCKTLQESESVDPSTPPTPQSASSFLPMATSADCSSDDFSATSSSLPLFTDELPSHLVEGLPEAGGAWRELLNYWEENAQSPGGVFVGNSPTVPKIPRLNGSAVSSLYSNSFSPNNSKPHD